MAVTGVPHGSTATAAVNTLNLLVDRYLARYMYTNASFMGERLFALSPTQETLHKLATCYMRMGEHGKVYQLLVRNLQEGSGTAPGTPAKQMNDTDSTSEFLIANRYLFAKCCFELGKLREAESALVLGTALQNNGPSAFDVNNPSSCPVPFGAAGLYLLGLICAHDSRVENAVEYFVLSLQLDPFLWDAYEQLCKLGATVPPSACFGIHEFESDSKSEGKFPINPLDYNEDALNRLLHSPLENAEYDMYDLAPIPVSGKWSISEEPVLQVAIPIPSRELDSIHYSNMESGNRTKLSEYPMMNLSPSDYDALPPVAKNGLRLSRFQSVAEPVAKQTSALAHDTPVSRPRRSSRRSVLSVSENQGQVNSTPVMIPTIKTGDAKNTFVDDSSDNANKLDLDQAIGSIQVLRLLYALGRGTILLSKFCCKEALEAFQALPDCQYNTGWVLHQIGKANFEMAKYETGRQCFEQMYQGDPGRMQGLELYSTNLWHLKKEIDLCYLAQRVVESSKLSPEAWCAVGNCFSLQKEHDVAIKFFERAIQLDPNFTYAYTLSGHEYVSNENFEKAVACYRHAIRKDARHYNAWYGLGTIFYRQEKLDLAEYHFRRAIAINPRSSVLYCYLGMVLGASNKCDDALRMLGSATILEPENPQARFQRATVLRNLERYEEALEELKAVRDFAPRESSVYFLMGKVSKQLGRKDQAMQYFTTALDLDPKDSNVIKSAIDKLDVADAEDDDEL